MYLAFDLSKLIFQPEHLWKCASMFETLLTEVISPLVFRIVSSGESNIGRLLKYTLLFITDSERRFTVEPVSNKHKTYSKISFE